MPQDPNALIDQSSPAHGEMVRRARLGRDLLQGSQWMRDQRETYLPRKERESPRAYTGRLNGTFLDDIYGRSVQEIADAPFERSITLDEDVPDLIRGFAENIDRAGRHLDIFARDVFRDAIIGGLSHILVDMPPSPERRTVAQDREAGRRPYLIHYRMEDVPRWLAVNQSGLWRLVRVHLKETTTESDDSLWGEREVHRVRVLYAAGFGPSGIAGSASTASFQVYRRNDDVWAQESEGLLAPLTEIPLATVYTMRTGFMTAVPPLETVSWTNLAHWQSSSMQRHVLDWSRFAMLFGRNLKGQDGKPIEVGPNRLIEGNGEHADLKYVEHQGQAIEAGERDLAKLEQRGQVQGREPLARSGQPTATAKALDEARDNRSARAWVRNLEDALEASLGSVAKYTGQKDGGSVSVFREFGLSLLDTEHLEALQAAYIKGDLSAEDYLGQLKRRGILEADFDAEAAVARARAAGPSLTGDPETLPPPQGRNLPPAAA